MNEEIDNGINYRDEASVKDIWLGSNITKGRYK